MTTSLKFSNFGNQTKVNEPFKEVLHVANKGTQKLLE